jgi:hypothetical protein
MKTFGGLRGSFRAGLAALLAAQFAAAPAGAFDEFPSGARPAALSGAFGGLADDVNSLVYNPAGLAELGNPQVTADYLRLLPSLTDETSANHTFLAYGQPLGGGGQWGGLGAGLVDFKLGSLFRERAVAAGYGKNLGRLSLGAAVKSLERRYGQDADAANAIQGPNPSNRSGRLDPVFQERSRRRATGLDLGLLARLGDHLSLGLSAANVNQPDLGLSQVQAVPRVLRAGASYRHRWLKANLDVTQREFLEGRTDRRTLIGAERVWVLGRFGEMALRAGTGFGSRDFRQLTLGGGYQANGLAVDYAFQMPLGGLESAGGSHRLSLSFKFGKAPGESELDSLFRREREAVERAERARQEAEAQEVIARAERDRLLQENAKLRKMAQEARPAAAPTPTEKKAQKSRERMIMETISAYQLAMTAYKRMAADGASLALRQKTLQDILAKYEKTGVSVKDAQEELARVGKELAKVQADYQMTLDFYRRSTAQGASTAERRSLLERIRTKYAPSGIDLSEVEQELKSLGN